MKRIRSSTRRLGPARAALLAVCAFLVAPTVLGAQSRRPNIVYINADDLGWADLACYGNDFNRTPAIDQIARQGMRFTQAYSCAPCCTPSRVGWVTGQHPARLHMTGQASFYQDPPVRKLLHPHFDLELPADTPTAAKALAAAGYVSVSLGKWGLGQSTTGHGYQRVEDAKDEAMTDLAVRFLREPPSSPFFLSVNYHWVQSPLRPDAKLAAANRERVKTTRADRNPDYAAVMEQLDQAVGQILRAIDESHLADNTLLIFAGDNGGFLGHDDERYTSNAPLREGKSSLYEGGIRVPFIVRWPQVVPAGVSCDSPVNNLDFFPTLAALCGAPLPGGARDGVDISPLLLGSAREAPPRDMFWHFPHYRRSMATIEASPASAVRHGDWKLLHFYEDDHVEVFNLREDPREQRDLAVAQPAQTAKLRRLLDDWRTAVTAQPPLRNPLYGFKGF